MPFYTTAFMTVCNGKTKFLFEILLNSLIRNLHKMRKTAHKRNQ